MAVRRPGGGADRGCGGLSNSTGQRILVTRGTCGRTDNRELTKNKGTDIILDSPDFSTQLKKRERILCREPNVAARTPLQPPANALDMANLKILPPRTYPALPRHPPRPHLARLTLNLLRRGRVKAVR